MYLYFEYDKNKNPKEPSNNTSWGEWDDKYLDYHLLDSIVNSPKHNSEMMDGAIGSSTSLETENANLKLLAKYLTLLLRKNEAERELYTIETGKREVYYSPTLVQLNKKITEFKQTIRANSDALKYFNENLDITL
jgi:hypothetical protein